MQARKAASSCRPSGCALDDEGLQFHAGALTQGDVNFRGRFEVEISDGSGIRDPRFEFARVETARTDRAGPAPRGMTFDPQAEPKMIMHGI